MTHTKKLSKTNQKRISGGVTRLQNCQQISPDCVFVTCPAFVIESICGSDHGTPVWCTTILASGGHCVCPPETIPAECNLAE